MCVSLLLGKIRLHYGSGRRLVVLSGWASIPQHERKHMVFSQLLPAPVRWLWYVILCMSLSGCSAAYHFRYQYTMVAPDSGSDGIENDHVRVRVAPTPEVGVLQLTVINKSTQPITIVWTQTR